VSMAKSSDLGPWTRKMNKKIENWKPYSSMSNKLIKSIYKENNATKQRKKKYKVMVLTQATFFPYIPNHTPSTMLQEYNTSKIP
jgi:hypothetical protein